MLIILGDRICVAGNLNNDVGVCVCLFVEWVGIVGMTALFGCWNMQAVRKTSEIGLWEYIVDQNNLRTFRFFHRPSLPRRMNPIANSSGCVPKRVGR